MADRTISVRLQALIGPYSAAMAKASRDTREFKGELGKAAREGSDFTKQLGTGMLVAGGAVALGFGKMISTGMGFEKQMAGVRAVSGASADEMKRLSEAALAAGASTKLAGVTASDAAAAQAELVKAGVSVDQVLGGALMGSLTLAAAGSLEFADAATIAAQAMNIFDLEGSEVAHVADVLAAAANKSAGDVGQFGDALRQGGLVAAQTGLSLEETVGALAAFADNALIGSDAGTSLKTMLQRLTPQSAEAAGLMEELGFSAYDAQGNFIGLEGLTRELQDSLGNMTVEQRNSAMATLFGSDAVRGANVLYSEGADKIREYIEAVDDQGAAAEMAAIMNDNLSGDIEALGGAIETVMIQGAGQATGVMRELTQTLTTMVSGFGSLEGPMGAAALGFTGILGAASLAGGATLHLAPKIESAKKALDGMGNAGQFASRNMGKFAGALGLAGIAIAGLTWYLGKQAQAQAEAEEAAQGYTDAIIEQGSVVGDTTDALALKAVLDGETGTALRDAGADLDVFTEALRESPEQIQALREELTGLSAITGSAGLASALDEAGLAGSALASELLLLSESLTPSQVSALVSRLDDQATAHAAGAEAAANQEAATKAAGDAAGDAVAPTNALAEATQDAADAEKEFEDALKAAKNAIRATLDPLFAAQDAMQGHKEAQDKVKAAQLEVLGATQKLDKAIAEHGRQSDEATKAAFELADAERDVEEANNAVARSALDTTAAARELSMRMDEQGLSVFAAEQQLHAWVAQGLLTEEQARQVGAELRGVVAESDRIDGRNINTTLTLDTRQFWMEFAAASYALRGSQIAAQLGGAGTAGLQVASGGYITGKGKEPIYRAMGGPSGTDTVPAWLTPGEYVVKKSAVDAVGLGFMHALNATRAPAPQMSGASGAGVGPSKTVNNHFHHHTDNSDAAAVVAWAVA